MKDLIIYSIVDIMSFVFVLVLLVTQSHTVIHSGSGICCTCSRFVSPLGKSKFRKSFIRELLTIMPNSTPGGRHYFSRSHSGQQQILPFTLKRDKHLCKENKSCQGLHVHDLQRHKRPMEDYFLAQRCSLTKLGGSDSLPQKF